MTDFEGWLPSSRAAPVGLLAARPQLGRYRPLGGPWSVDS